MVGALDHLVTFERRDPLSPWLACLAEVGGRDEVPLRARMGRSRPRMAVKPQTAEAHRTFAAPRIAATPSRSSQSLSPSTLANVGGDVDTPMTLATMSSRAATAHAVQCVGSASDEARASLCLKRHMIVRDLAISLSSCSRVGRGGDVVGLPSTSRQ